MNLTEEQALELVDKYWEREYNKIQSIDFPKTREHEVSEEKMKNELFSLETKELSWKANSSLLAYFHPSLRYANKKGKLSPYEFWCQLKKNPTMFKKFYKNRLKCSDYFKESEEKNKLLWKGEVPEFIYGIGLTTGMFAPRVSIFKPAAAKSLIKAYLDEFDTIFDPTAGYSGRMIGAVCCGKNYIGRDINDLTIEEDKNCWNFVKENISTNPTVDLAVADALAVKGEYDCLMTCPPYEKIEEWKNSKGEKISSTKTCDEWIEALIDNYKCKKYVIVVDNKIDKFEKYVKGEFENTNYIGARKGKLTKASFNSEKIVVIE